MQYEDNLPTISIVTPSYHQGQFLEECIQSVVKQEYPKLEYFIIDGGSKDNSTSIIEKYADKLTYWVSEPDGGQTDAINKGFRMATGEIVAWLNADDFYLPGALAKVACAYRRHPYCSFYFGDGLRVDERGRKISGFFPEGNVLFNRNALIHGFNYILQPATLINRAHLVEVNYLDQGLRYGMDTDLWVRLSAVAPPLSIPEFLAASREYGATKTSTGSFSRVEELRQIAQRHSDLPMTPGVLCYFLDTLCRMVDEGNGPFPSSYKESVERFWAETSKLLLSYGARPDGFPVVSDRPRADEPIESIGLPQAYRSQHYEKTWNMESKAMKIGIELRQITLGATGGITQLLKGLLEALFALTPEDELILFCTMYNRGLVESLPHHVRALTLPTYNYFSELDRIAAEEDIQVLFRSYPMEDSCSFPLSRQVFLIPDIQHEVFPGFFSPEVLRARRAAFNRTLSGSGAVGTISDYARSTILKHEWTVCRDVFLASPALQVEHERSSSDSVSTEELALVPAEDFFIYPANLWPHKNHRRIVEAFRLFTKRTGLPMSFVLTGHPEGWSELKTEIGSLSIRHLGFVRPQFLRLLIQKARALAFFSLYEGFGMPLLEAFSAGTPVICSNTTSLPEVGGDAVLTCDPTDVQSMADLMERIVQDNPLRAALVERGRKRLDAYSWEQSARNLLNAFHRVANRASEKNTHGVIVEEHSRPLVSIVTPSYNQGRFLRRTVESVLSQSYPNIQYIVMDGGSKDESIDVLKSYGARFQWTSEEDRGQADAINKGFTRSIGEILAYLNSDDVLLPDAVAKVVTHFQQHPDCDLVYGKAHYIDEEDRVTGFYNTADYSFARLMQDCCICQPAAFWRRRIAGIVGPFNDRLQYVMDYDYWLRIDRAGGRVEHTHEVLAASRLYPETKTLSARSEIYREIFEICQAHGGYVDINYFYGLWHHICYEKDESLWRHLRRMSRTSEVMAKISHRWYHHRKAHGTSIASGMLKRLVHRMAESLPLPSHVREGFPILPGHFGNRKRVVGLTPDNWLAPACRILLREHSVGHRLHLRGIVHVDMTLTIKANGSVLGVFPLRAGRHETVSFDGNFSAGTQLHLRFSRHIVDSAKRRLSFLITDTNLFSEMDAANP